MTKKQINLKYYHPILVCGLVCCIFCFMFTGSTAIAADKGDIVKDTLKQSTEKAEKIKEKREAEQKEKRLAFGKKPVAEVNGLPENIHLPEDSTLLLNVSKIELTGNKLLTTDELLRNIPSVYNTSNEKSKRQTLFFFMI